MRCWLIDVFDARHRRLPETVARSNWAGGRGNEVSEMSYLNLLRLAMPEIVITATALIVLAVGLTNSRSSASRLCQLVAAIGLAIAVGVILTLPQNAGIGAGMLVISPLSSLFKIICIALALFTVILNQSSETTEHAGEFLAIVLF